MTFHVCIDMGEWDHSISSFETECGAQFYLKGLTPLTIHPLKVLEEDKMRNLREFYVLDEICVIIEKEESNNMATELKHAPAKKVDFGPNQGSIYPTGDVLSIHPQHV